MLSVDRIAATMYNTATIHGYTMASNRRSIEKKKHFPETNVFPSLQR